MFAIGENDVIRVKIQYQQEGQEILNVYHMMGQRINPAVPVTGTIASDILRVAVTAAQTGFLLPQLSDRLTGVGSTVERLNLVTRAVPLPGGIIRKTYVQDRDFAPFVANGGIATAPLPTYVVARFIQVFGPRQLRTAILHVSGVPEAATGSASGDPNLLSAAFLAAVSAYNVNFLLGVENVPGNLKVVPWVYRQTLAERTADPTTIDQFMQSITGVLWSAVTGTVRHRKPIRPLL